MPTAWAEGPSNTRRHPDPIQFKAGQGLYSRSLCLPFCVSSSLACPHLPDRPPSGSNWIHEVKHDGYRLMAQLEEISARSWSRP